MITILIYHSVSDREYEYSVSPSDFEIQLRYLKDHFRILTIQEFEKIFHTRQMPKEDCILLTFDDGVRDNMTQAYPILYKHNVPATIFISTLFVGTIHSGPSDHQFEWLSWDDLRKLNESKLISLENHTHTHPLLTEISDEKIIEEIQTCHSLLQERVGINSKYFAYPKNDVDDRVKRVVQQHCALAFGTEGIITNIEHVDPHLIPRISIYRTTSIRKFKWYFSPRFWILRKIKRVLYG